MWQLNLLLLVLNNLYLRLILLNEVVNSCMTAKFSKSLCGGGGGFK